MKGKISMGQLMALFFVGVLAPTVRQLPLWNAAEAGTAGWISTLAALPILLGFMLLVLRCVRRLGPSAGLGELMEAAFGRAGRWLCLVYALWFFLLLSVSLRYYGERFLSAAYRDTTLYLFLVVLLILLLWIAHGSLGALARAGRIFFLALAVVMGAVLIFGAADVRMDNLFPLWVEDVPGVLRSLPVTLGTLGCGAHIFFLAGRLLPARNDQRVMIKWVCALCVILSAASFVILGVFGLGMVSRMQMPFFILAKDLSLFDTVDRMESVVVTVWVLTDVIYLSLYLFLFCAALRFACRLEEGRHITTPMIFALLPAAFLVAANAFSLGKFSQNFLAWGNLLVSYLLPAGACLAARLRKRI